MTESAMIKWINNNVGSDIDKAISDTKEVFFAKDVLIGMAYRETGLKLMELLNLGNKVPSIFSLVRGDYSKRSKDASAMYHGYGLWQVDIDSFPDFVRSGDWKTPYKCCVKALEILNGNKKYLSGKFPALSENDLLINSIAAYNCGIGNQSKTIQNKQDTDTRTFNHDYSKEVMRFSAIAAQLP
jgi:hypothetical protein